MKDESCFELVQNALMLNGRRDSDMLGTYGDLLIAAERLIFVPLASVRLPQGGLSGVAEDPVKGWARMLGLINRKKEVLDALTTARHEAEGERKRYFGLSFEARIRRHVRKKQIGQRSEAVVLVRTNVRGLKLHSSSSDIGLIEVALTDGEPVLMEVAGAAPLYDRLHSWLSGMPVAVSCDFQGLDLELPDHTQLLKWIEEPSALHEITLEHCVRAAKTTSYCEELAEQVKKRRWSQRTQLCEMIKERSAALGSAIGLSIVASPLGRGWKEGLIACGVLSACLAVVTFFVLASGPTADPAGDAAARRWVLIALIGLVLLGLLVLGLALRDRRRNKRLAGQLCN